MTTSRYWDEEIFKDYNFVKVFKDVSLRNFIFKVPQERFPKLVKMFYANIFYYNGVISSKVNKHSTNLPLKN